MKKRVEKSTLANGMTLLYLPISTDSLTMQILVHVGSNNETPKQAGLAHFLEHMVFEGTKNRPTSRQIANEIETVGGDFNAYTTPVRTCYYVKLPRKHARRAIDVLSDMLQNPSFTPEDIQKQPAIIEKEIDLLHDEPRMLQWVLFEQSLYKKHPVRNPTYGNKKVLFSLTRKQITNFFAQYYTPKNMTLVIVGKVPNLPKLLNQYLTTKGGKRYTAPGAVEPAQKRQTKTRKRNTSTSYLLIGYRTVPRTHNDSYVLDVIDAILGRGQSGWLFDQVRSVHGLAYEAGSQHESETNYGFFAAHASVAKKNLAKTKQVVLDQFARLQHITEQEVGEAKDFIEGSFLLDNEDTQKLADALAFWEHMGDANLFFSYLDKIKAVSVKDVKRVAKKYFHENYTMTVIEGK